MSKAFGEQNPTQGEDAVSWATWSDGAAGSVEVVGDAAWGKLRLEYSGEEGRSAVYDLGSEKTRKFTLTENRYGSGTGSAVLQYRTSTTSFAQDDASPTWINYAAPFSVNCRYVQTRETTDGADLPGYFVATDGSNDDPGTLAEPWLTITYAISQLNAGDTLYIRAGTYNERVYINKSGSSGNIITIRNYPSESVSINGLGVALDYENGLVQFHYVDYVKVQGLYIYDSQRAGICGKSSDYIYIENCHTYDTGRSGIGLWTCTHVDISGCEIERPCVIDAGKNKDGVDESISVANSSNYVYIYDCVVHDTPTGYNPARAGGEGVNVKDGGTYVWIHDNEVYNINNKFGFACDGWDLGVNHLYYYNNIVHDCKWGFLPETEKAGTTQYVEIYNNIIYDMHEEDDTPGIGVYIPDFGTSDGWNKDYKIVNNTIYNCGAGIRVNNDLVDNILIANNILDSNVTYNIEVIASAEAETTIDHNLFDGAGDHHGTNSTIGDADFVTPGSDFHLQATSDAIGNGGNANAPAVDYDGVTRGAAIDIGAFEYVA